MFRSGFDKYESGERRDANDKTGYDTCRTKAFLVRLDQSKDNTSETYRG